ncbi:potassium channel family protein [Microbacterium mangrovi]|uniref:potassium channel family protein n=1 Tax=Microbacterium mangrovi TaxID=1348253 RepID=UPI00068CF618|nr:potassium channel family protein [Microbacterium mangrovi]
MDQPRFHGEIESDAERAWRRFTRIPLPVASVTYLVAYSWKVIADLHGSSAEVLIAIILVSWAMFIVNYLVRLSLSPHKWLWFRTHPAELAFALMPVLRIVLVLRVFTDLPGVSHSRSSMRRNRLAVYGVGSVIILIYLGALFVLDVERNAPGATIVSFGDAIWWACTTATTTGYGDYTPVTIPGRTIGVGLMFGGLTLIGILTASLSSWVAERNRPRDAADRGDDPDAGSR